MDPIQNKPIGYQLGYYLRVGDRPALTDIELTSLSHDFQQGYHDREILRYGIASCSFLIPRNTTYTCNQFATAIREYSTHPRTQEVARVIEQSGLTFEHDIYGDVTGYREEIQQR